MTEELNNGTPCLFNNSDKFFKKELENWRRNTIANLINILLPRENEYEIAPYTSKDGVETAVARVYFKGFYKDGFEHYEVAIDRNLANALLSKQEEP